MRRTARAGRLFLEPQCTPGSGMVGGARLGTDCPSPVGVRGDWLQLHPEGVAVVRGAVGLTE